MAKFHQKLLYGQTITPLGTFSDNFLYALDEVSEGKETLLVGMNHAYKLCIEAKIPYMYLNLSKYMVLHLKNTLFLQNRLVIL